MSCTQGVKSAIYDCLVITFAAGRQAEYCDEHVCLCVCIHTSKEPHICTLQHFVCMLSMAVTQIAFSGVAVQYVLLVLLLTSHVSL